MSFLLRPFVFCGSVYRAFYEKDKTVFLFRTNEMSVGNSISSTRVVPGRLSLTDFLEFHNPLEPNSKQTVAKWASRFALGLSTSAPGLKLKAENIHEIEDIMSVEGEDMTDGSGFINQAALRLLQSKFKWDEWPTAIQCRVAGAKGMLLQHPNNENHEPEVWIRPSQTKIRYSNNDEDECRLIIDVLRSCHSRSSCVLGTETIINMAENGIPAKRFFKLLDEGFNRLITSLTTWEGEDAMYNLWATVARLGGVRAARAARVQAGLARVLGYSEGDAQDDEDEDGLDEQESEDSSVAWWGDEISGQPSSLEETVMRLLDAGFNPYICSVLREKLSAIVTTHIQNYGAKYRVEVPMSCMTFIQPDPLGVLEEGQIFYKSARRDLPTLDGHLTDTIIGPVLVTRHPCKLPTDVQKWDAVDCPQLRDQTGIIFFSIKGRRRAADYLGGGDYDGDKSLLIYDPSIVDPFVNADIRFADPRNDIEEKCFVKGTKKLPELVAEHIPTKENPLARVRALQDFLLGGLRNISRVGQYSNMHDYCTVTKGYTHEDTIRMAHMFCRTLDGAKTGLTVREDVFTADRKSYNRGVMKWKKPAVKSSMKSQYVSDDGGMKVKRPKHLGPFIMDSLVKYSLHRAATFERQFKERMLKHKKHIIDEHLVEPWRKAEKYAQQKKEKGCPLDMQALDEIRSHVKKVYEKHREQVKKMRPKRNGGHFTDLPIEIRQNQLRDLSKEFASYPNPDDLMLDEDIVSRLRASYAYLHDCEANKYTDKGWTRFPWDVAMSELCLIKGKAIGGSKTVVAGFYDRFFLTKTRQ
ncbi:hypothetical protein Moror_7426 [Moniliophthora roreri MCA 2997]|uniref:RNA-dependent RNA polymerase n=1 Tax=Moniliophthora roreri (strain MCA 2997) TaxID=1381753 RepID=V2XT90_MONRO|nr:hypothetical protein Moror_7426 [Moniliophthora roreri MCA 2997]